MNILNYVIDVWILLCIGMCYYGISLQYINILLLPVITITTLVALMALAACIIILMGWFPKSLNAFYEATVNNKFDLKNDEYYKKYYKK